MTQPLHLVEPLYEGNSTDELRAWALHVRLPWLVSTFNLVVGAICGSVPEEVRRKVYDGRLLEPVDWYENAIVIAPPGTGKGMALFVDALSFYETIYVIAPSVVQAHKLADSLNTLYAPGIAGCMTSQRKEEGLIQVVTTGVFHQIVRDRKSDLWVGNSALFVDEAQRVLTDQPETEFLVGYCAQQGVPTYIVSATIAPGELPAVYGRTIHEPARVHLLDKQMFPVEISVLKLVDWDSYVTRSLGDIQPTDTVLYFCPARHEVQRTCGLVRKAGLVAVPITGAHEVDVQLAKVEAAQVKGGGVVIVATPGTMDSSVTIPGLTSVHILDRRISVKWNGNGVRERFHEALPINEIWQMIRRVGRIARTDGGVDKAFVVSNGSRSDVLRKSRSPEFMPIQGAGMHVPIERMVLESCHFDVPFREIHEYMITQYSDAHIDRAYARLVSHKMLVRKKGGGVLTGLGKMVLALPFEYPWSRLIALAPVNVRPYLCLAASCGSLQSLKSHERDAVFFHHPSSEVIQKMLLGIEFAKNQGDEQQAAFAETYGLSKRRLQQMMELFRCAVAALGLDFEAVLYALEPPSKAMTITIQSILATLGIQTELFEPFFLSTSYSAQEVRNHGGKRPRYFVTNESSIEFEKYSVAGLCLVVAGQMWVSSGKGKALATLEDMTVVRPELIPSIVAQYAREKNWMKLQFKEFFVQGQRRLAAKRGIFTYVLPDEVKVEKGREYWCSVVDEYRNSICVVSPKYPVLPDKKK